MEILVFGKSSCGKCRTTRNKLAHLLKKWGITHEARLIYYDVETVDGMVEGAFRDVMAIPTVIVGNGGRELGRWQGVVPNSGDIRNTVSAE